MNATAPSPLMPPSTCLPDTLPSDFGSARRGMYFETYPAAASRKTAGQGVESPGDAAAAGEAAAPGDAAAAASGDAAAAPSDDKTFAVWDEARSATAATATGATAMAATPAAADEDLLVVAPPPDPLAALLDQRRYLAKGVPMLKRILALLGQTVR